MLAHFDLVKLKLGLLVLKNTYHALQLQILWVILLVSRLENTTVLRNTQSGKLHDQITFFKLLISWPSSEKTNSAAAAGATGHWTDVHASCAVRQIHPGGNQRAALREDGFELSHDDNPTSWMARGEVFGLYIH